MRKNYKRGIGLLLTWIMLGTSVASAAQELPADENITVAETGAEITNEMPELDAVDAAAEADTMAVFGTAETITEADFADDFARPDPRVLQIDYDKVWDYQGEYQTISGDSSAEDQETTGDGTLWAEDQVTDYLAGEQTKKQAITLGCEFIQMADPNCHLKLISTVRSDTEKKALKEQADKIIAGKTKTYDKIAAVNKWLAENIYYDYQYINDRSQSSLVWYPYDVMQKKITVCEGYSQLAEAFLQLENIPCMGISANDHRYNAAYDWEAKKWIIFDPTWCSGNKFTKQNGTYTKVSGKMNTTHFDMTADTMSKLNNHEIYSIYDVYTSKEDSLTYTVHAPEGDWGKVALNINNWSISVSQPRKAGALYALDSLKNVKVKEFSSPYNASKELLEAITELDLRATSITKLGTAFTYYPNLQYAYIPSSVTSINNGALKGLSKLKSFDMGALKITKIPDSMFDGCSSLKGINLPSGITEIGNYAFSRCSSISWPLNNRPLTKIGDYAFQYCDGLARLELPASLETMGNGVFYGCKNLIYVDLGKTKLTSMGYSVLPAYFGAQGTFVFPRGLTKASESVISKIYPSGSDTSNYELAYFDESGNSYSSLDSAFSAGKYVLTYGMRKTRITIHYELNGGSNSNYNPSTVYRTGSVSLRNPSRSGYDFAGWFLDAAFQIPVTEIVPSSDADITVYAKWTVKQSDGNGNGGSSNEAMPVFSDRGTLAQDAYGNFLYYENGVFVPNKYGYVGFGGSGFLVANGRVATEINGLAPDPEAKAFYYLSNGQVQTQYTGLVQYDGAWFYVGHGKMDVNKTGFVDYDGSKFYVGLGRIMTEVSGLAQDPATGKWYYLSGGQVQTQYSGLVQYDGVWFYVSNGWMNPKAYGWTQYNGSWFYVLNGMVVAQE